MSIPAPVVSLGQPQNTHFRNPPAHAHSRPGHPAKAALVWPSQDLLGPVPTIASAIQLRKLWHSVPDPATHQGNPNAVCPETPPACTHFSFSCLTKLTPVKYVSGSPSPCPFQFQLSYEGGSNKGRPRNPRLCPLQLQLSC